MASRNKPGIFAGALLTLSLSLAANAQQSTDPIRIAYIEPLSGAFANVGDAGLKHFRYAADMINQQGGVMGRKFEIVPMDNKQSASESIQLLQRAIDEGIPFVPRATVPTWQVLLSKPWTAITAVMKTTGFCT